MVISHPYCESPVTFTPREESMNVHSILWTNCILKGYTASSSLFTKEIGCRTREYQPGPQSYGISCLTLLQQAQEARLQQLHRREANLLPVSHVHTRVIHQKAGTDQEIDFYYA